MNILQQIVEHKKQEISENKKRLPESELREQAFPRGKRRPFVRSLEMPQEDGINLIAEIKRASPSKGMIRPDLDVAQYASEYQLGGASALSVLTDSRYFRGSVEDLKMAKRNTSLPVLRKDFIISSYQIHESVSMEADAVLLIVRILSSQQLKDYINLCKEIGMDVLVETHSREEVETATAAGAKLIGINNRNLSSFKTDVETAARLVSLLSPEQNAVAESGIKSRKDIEKLMDAGIRNFLVGESLVRATDAKAFLRNLLGVKL